MAKLKLEGNASGTGTFTIAAPNSNSDRTLDIPDEAGTILTDASDLPAANLTGTLPAIDGSNLTGIGGGFSSVQVFTSSGTWTRPSGVKRVLMYVTGAGGDGGASVGDGYTAGSGGGAGATAIKTLDVSSISTATITVGTNGNPGGTSSWSDGTNTISATGGSRGAASANNSGTTGTGGEATGGDANIPGGWGDIRASSARGGIGGSSFWGSPDSWTANSPVTVTVYGAGGVGSNGGDVAGGQGGDGIVVILEYK